jgi:OOP family OmpA-OmpF porin
MTRLPLSLALLLAAAPAFADDAPLQKVSVRAVAHFDFDRARLSAADQNTMLAEVVQMKDVTWQSVTAIGHTDSVGSAAYNQRLAAQRARSVRDYLVAKGLDPSMINTEALAAQAPVADNDSAEGRARNRRAEIEFTGVRGTAR